MRLRSLTLAGLLALLSAPAFGQCVFGAGQLDNIAPLAAGAVRPPWNTMICAVNAMERRLLGTTKQDTAYVDDVTVPAATEMTVTITGLAPFLGNEVITPTFADAAASSTVIAENVLLPAVSATMVTVTLFNSDNGADHTGRLMVVILRP